MRSDLDVVTLLRRLHFEILDGSGSDMLLESPEGHRWLVRIASAVDRVTAETSRKRMGRGSGDAITVMTGKTITGEMLVRAQRGELHVLTESPLQLIIDGQHYRRSDASAASNESRSDAIWTRPAWVRWAVMRTLVVADHPIRQAELAARLHTTPQAVSKAVHRLRDWVTPSAGGLRATDKTGLLMRWIAEYPGPGGQQFGWYSLEPAVKQSGRAFEIATLWDASPRLSGDVAADQLVPWKLPTTGRIYVKKSFDLEDDGFVPTSLEQATLVLCVPDDTTLWSDIAGLNPRVAARPDLVDPAIVYWDVRQGKDVDAPEAAEKLASVIFGGARARARD